MYIRLNGPDKTKRYLHSLELSSFIVIEREKYGVTDQFSKGPQYVNNSRLMEENGHVVRKVEPSFFMNP